MSDEATANGTDSAKPRHLYLTIPEAALVLGVSGDTIRRRIKTGELPATIFAKKYRIHRDDLDRLVGRVA